VEAHSQPASGTLQCLEHGDGAASGTAKHLHHAEAIGRGSVVILSGHSMRIPLIARAITNCWISLVPSKIVWITVQGFLGCDA
jgi:hypothetical protein